MCGESERDFIYKAISKCLRNLKTAGNSKVILEHFARGGRNKILSNFLSWPYTLKYWVTSYIYTCIENCVNICSNTY